MRVGHGYDLHRLAKGRRLVLGGIVIPHDRGLEGHSDADVLVHAIIDALLGAAALGNIGQHFPDNDPAYKNADSIMLLKKVMALILDKGYVVENVDATLIAEKPKLNPFLDTIRTNLAACLNVDLDCVSVKAKTNERVGPEGREEAISAHAVVLLSLRT
ncbi:MAG TPA: 2-C-methyl-D-erythritol 2,4-cyclodiphosphate synthase [Candidatus Hydrogenedentes bacterium]|nr:2-C-methyl-D-erythritol 2,4-cyclodiphosphate synthase [Candidatus Hydrogenedentota bacterium]HOL77407.1 2-C-methyl-D-erythritol 2,4-cyclodiphosphate synthase [Candidatus Hydrogenedentota bacterium]HPO84550.1 2-C-methyl-D-erythritol 2,4-cyclodiphosphate synthase [Candidatus Hydrogenedentota bacterium]